ncbi:carbohydrate ABC transporter permease [Microvirga alba]|uniref:Carbohydrate ABC transporter permease n=1 Tax=Microvirga alba TaxID=2791025 RepID=A0A931BTI3_9HYPH|nr:carbohydrate ABC transporter permease [Microvirga alba]MBF9235434.1 carbohydrate ABC transporter permease [Microvirga alba]
MKAMSLRNPVIRRNGNFLIGTAVVTACLWVLVPLYFLAVNALSSPKAVIGFPKPAVPQFNLESVHFFATYEGVATALLNSVLVAGLTMVLAIGLGAPAGYALARFDFPGKSAFRLVVLMTRAFPLPLLALPLTVLYIRTGLDDTALGLAFVHTTLALPFSILITASLFLSIPVELEEAAWTLGCTRIGAFRHIVLPLAVPGIAASAVFAFVTSWNEVFAAAVLTVQHRTLTAFLLQSLDVSPLPLKFAGAAALVLPTLIFLFAVRKYLFSLWGIANR